MDDKALKRQWEYIEELTKSTREIEYPEADLVESEELGKLYRSVKDIIYRELEEQPEVLELTEENRKRLSEKLPACMAYIITEMPTGSKINFNKLVVHLITYFQMAGWNKRDVWAKVQPFIENYPHSETYDTPEKRLSHWKAEWSYLQNNPDYSFSCAYIKGLGLPGHAFDCRECIDKECKLEPLGPEQTKIISFIETEPPKRKYVFEDL